MIPQEGKIGVRSSLIEYNSSRIGCVESYQVRSTDGEKRRAQAVPMAQKLSCLQLLAEPELEQDCVTEAGYPRHQPAI